MSKDPLYKSMISHTSDWASRRKMAYKKIGKKITGANLSAEIKIAKILGYLDSAEHLLKAITLNPDWDREEIESQLHFYIRDISNIAENALGQESVIDLEYILKEYGYYKDNG